MLGKAVMCQEDPETTHIEREQALKGGKDWVDKWESLPIGANGRHYVLLHLTCWDKLFAQLMKGENKVAFTFLVGDIDELQEVVLP